MSLAQQIRDGDTNSSLINRFLAIRKLEDWYRLYYCFTLPDKFLRELAKAQGVGAKIPNFRDLAVSSKAIGTQARYREAQKKKELLDDLFKITGYPFFHPYLTSVRSAKLAMHNLWKKLSVEMYKAPSFSYNIDEPLPDHLPSFWIEHICFSGKHVVFPPHGVIINIEFSIDQGVPLDGMYYKVTYCNGPGHQTKLYDIGGGKLVGKTVPVDKYNYCFDAYLDLYQHGKLFEGDYRVTLTYLCLLSCFKTLSYPTKSWIEEMAPEEPEQKGIFYNMATGVGLKVHRNPIEVTESYALTPHNQIIYSGIGAGPRCSYNIKS